MKKLLFPLLAVGLLGLFAWSQDRPALADRDDADRDEQEIAIKDLPAPIRRALKDLKLGQIAEIERERTKSGSVYEIELRVGKREVELKLDAKGRLLGVEIEQEDDDDDDDSEDHDDDNDRDDD